MHRRAIDEHLLAGRLDEAEEMARAVRDDPSLGGFADVALCRIAAARGDVSGAVRALEVRVREDPRDPEAMAYLALLLAHDGDPARAVLLGRRASALGAQVPALDVLLGEAALDDDDLDEAADRFLAALDRQPELSSGWMGLGRLRRREGDLEGAEEAFARAVQLAPLRIDAWVDLVLVERDLDARQAAAHNLGLALQVHRGHPGLVALQQADEALADDPGGAVLAEVRARIAVGDVEGAGRVLYRGPLDDDDMRDVLARAELAVAAGGASTEQVPELIHLLLQHDRTGAGGWDTKAVLARLLVRPSPMRNPRLAVATAEDAFGASDEHPRAGLALAEAYRAVGKDVFARKLLERIASAGGPEADSAQAMLES